MLRTHDLGVSVSGRPLLDGVDLVFPPGRLTVIVGPNGAGKTTLLGCLTGERAPSRGRVELYGRDLARYSAADLARRRAVLPQASQLSFPFQVGEVVELGLSGPGTGRRANGRDRVAGAPDIVARALAIVDLEGYRARIYQTLSGGEKQRVHLARALCQVWEPMVDGEARYLFLDEPTASLDLRHQVEVLEIARDAARRGLGVVAVLHDLPLARAFADEVIVLDRGTVDSVGDPHAVLGARTLQRVFRLNAAHLELLSGETRTMATPPPAQAGPDTGKSGAGGRAAAFRATAQIHAPPSG